jgi:hypothetical protein
MIRRIAVTAFFCLWHSGVQARLNVGLAAIRTDGTSSPSPWATPVSYPAKPAYWMWPSVSADTGPATGSLGSAPGHSQHMQRTPKSIDVRFAPRVWTAPSWQGLSSRRRVGRCSRVFGLT